MRHVRVKKLIKTMIEGATIVDSRIIIDVCTDKYPNFATPKMVGMILRSEGFTQQERGILIRELNS